VKSVSEEEKRGWGSVGGARTGAPTVAAAAPPAERRGGSVACPPVSIGSSSRHGSRCTEKKVGFINTNNPTKLTKFYN